MAGNETVRRRGLVVWLQRVGGALLHSADPIVPAAISNCLTSPLGFAMTDNLTLYPLGPAGQGSSDSPVCYVWDQVQVRQHLYHHL